LIDLYYAPTPNGWKISIMLEECEMDYKLILVNLGKGDQFKPDFLKISPNNRMPVIVDHNNIINDEPMSIFESGAILMYLAERAGKFFPSKITRQRKSFGMAILANWRTWTNGRSSKSFCKLCA
jgi:GST-like protein